MDIAFLLGTKIIELTLIVLIGYGLVKSKLLKSEDSKTLSVIGLYVISPAVMIEAFQIDYTPEILQGLQLSLFMAVFLQVILIIIGSLLKRLLNLDPIEHATSIYSNSGNLIIPIVMSLFGKEWVIYASCFIVVQTFLFWTHCRLIIVGKGNLSLKMITKNINIWSILVGAFLFAFQIKLPSIINGTLSSIGLFIGPNAMLVAGMLIAGMDVKDCLKNNRLYVITFLKMIVFPLFAVILFKFTNLSSMAKNGDMILLISLLASVAPTAASVTQIAQIYDADSEYASAYYFITTLLCILTMPIFVWIYQY